MEINIRQRWWQTQVWPEVGNAKGNVALVSGPDDSERPSQQAQSFLPHVTLLATPSYSSATRLSLASGSSG